MAGQDDDFTVRTFEEMASVLTSTTTTMTYLLASFHFAKRAYREIKRTGGYTGLSNEECVAARHEIETLVGLDEFYRIEEETVEKKKWGKR